MIPLSMTSLLMIYFGSLLLFFLFLWSIDHWQQRKRVPLPPLYHFLHCEYCHFPFLSIVEEEITRCPQCQSLIRKEKL